MWEGWGGRVGYGGGEGEGGEGVGALEGGLEGGGGHGIFLFLFFFGGKGGACGVWFVGEGEGGLEFMVGFFWWWFLRFFASFCVLFLERS